MKLSIIIPCYNSEQYLKEVVGGITEEFSLSLKDYSYQLVLVNDNSRDKTFEIIKEICSNDNNIIGLNLSRNYGQESAKLSGLEYADGDIIVFMDDDGQHPIDKLHLLVERIKEGNDVVYASFPTKKESLFRRIASKLHLKLSERLEVSPKGINLSSFVAWSRFAADCALRYRSPFPSVGTYLMKCTDKFANVEIEQLDRIAGKTNYTFKKLFNVAITNFTNFSIKPLRLASGIGFLASVVGFVFAIVTIIRKLLNPSIVLGYTSLISVILITFGLTMIILGIFGEYLGKIYMVISDQPQFTVKEVVNYERKEDE